jgi:tRNA C32,U32 (ribose-2'-O)-methylase TrmJ
MTRAKYLEKRLTACLRQAESTQKTAERLMEHIRLLIELVQDENQKADYQRQLRRLQSVVRSCENEANTLRELIRRVRGETPKHTKTPPPPPQPTTIRVLVPKDLQIPDEIIKQIVLQTLNGYAKETEAR